MSDRPIDLRTEYAHDPLGIDEPNPVLRWRVETDRRGARQSAFRVLVASAPELLAPGAANVWDSSQRCSDRPAVEYDGPALAAGERYHWTVRVWDAAGRASAWSDPAAWEMGLLGADDWDASWIRRSRSSDEHGHFSCFRRPVAVAGEIERARAYVSASHQYALSINGQPADRGQAFAYPDYQYYKTIDVTDRLASDNVLGVVHAHHGAGQGRPASEPGFILQLVIDFADGSSRTVVTDDSWETTAGPWLDAPLRNGEIAEPVEIVDGRRLAPGWDEPGFDASWEPAESVGAHPTEPWERLVAQNRAVTHTTIEPESVERLESGSIVFDFGRVYAGRPVVRFESGTADHRVELRAGYRREDGAVVREGTQATDMRYGYVQRDGSQAFRPFNYLGLRYLQIDDPGEPLSREQVSLIASHNAVPDRRAATFDSSNPVLDEVVELARHSALYGCQEGFVDTPTREKGQFLLDACNVSRVTTVAFRERRLSRGAIREFVRSHYRYWAPEGRLNAVYPNGDGKRDIPDFTAAFPEWVWRYYLVADDRRVLDTAYPVVRAVVDYILRHVDPDSGLVTEISGGEGGPYEAGIVDWPPEMRYGYDREWPALTTVNLLGVNALQRAASIAAELDRPEPELSYFRERRQALETAVLDRLHDGDLFVDGCDAHAASDHASQHANALALAVGIVPEPSVETVTEHVIDSGMRMGPMMVPWLLEALQTVERPAAMVELLTDPTQDGWAKVLRRNGTFTWESWHCGDDALPDRARRNRSESHAMGATVFTYVLQALLGVREEHADRQLRIRPPADGLDRATGRVPTECGEVAVSWDREQGLTLSVTIPWNTTATVVLPDQPERVAVDGTVLDPDAPACESELSGVDAVRAGETVEIDVATGTYRITTGD